MSAAPTLCLITDRRRLVAAVNDTSTPWSSLLLRQLEGAVLGGIDVVQIREPEVAAGELVRVAKDCMSLVQGTSTRVVVNDRIDVALAARTHGVHLREASLATDLARRLLGEGCTLGRSVHTPEGAAAAQSADYLIAGNVFETESKPGAPPRLGMRGLSAIVLAAGDCPVWAIGGMTEDRVPLVVKCGVRGVAAIGAFIPDVTSGKLTQAVQELTEKVRFSFDRSFGLF